MQIITKFNPGDKVRIIDPAQDERIKAEHVGMVDTIHSISYKSNGWWYVLLNSHLMVEERWIELAEPPTETFVCDKCGKVITYRTDEWDWHKEECHHINLGRPGYGSGLDGCDVAFNICDDCLIEFIETFTWEGKAKVFNSGSNTYGSNEDWIKFNKGDMSDDELKEKGYM